MRVVPAANQNDEADVGIYTSLWDEARPGNRRRYVSIFDRGNLQIDNSRLPLRMEQACEMQAPFDMRAALISHDMIR